MTAHWPPLAVLAMLAVLLSACSEPEHVEGKPYHHVAGGFRNPPDSPERHDWTQRMSWLIGKAWRSASGDDRAPVIDYVLPKEEVVRRYRESEGQNTVTWIGHMTALLRLDGRTVLTDPFLSDYATPLPPFGPKRYVPPAMTADELPPIDVVVISHSHFDHLDLETIDMLPNRGDITAVVPLKLGDYFRERGYGKVIELDWYETAEADGLKFTALPVIHWSKRWLHRTNDTLWSGFAIEASDGARLYFGGDAEYGPVYARLAGDHGGFDLALLSIGAFLPRVVMNGAHCVPENCVKIGTDLASHSVMAMHWGTIQLGDDLPQQGIARFREGGAAAGLPPERVWVMNIGETRVLPKLRDGDKAAARTQ